MKREVTGMDFTARQAIANFAKSYQAAGAVMETSDAQEHISIHVETALDKLAKSIINRESDGAGPIWNGAGLNAKQDYSAKMALEASKKISELQAQSAGRISAMLKGQTEQLGNIHENDVSCHVRDGDNEDNDRRNTGGDARAEEAVAQSGNASEAAGESQAKDADTFVNDEEKSESTKAAKVAKDSKATKAKKVTKATKASKGAKTTKAAKASATAKKPSLLNDMLLLMLKLSAIALAFTLLLTFMFGLIRYQEPSMAPAIKDGDLVLFHRHIGDGYKPGDAVVMDYGGKRQVRRVVATAGDTVDIIEEGLLINGALQQEQEIYFNTERYQDGVDFPLTVPEGHVFLLSDSRQGATDSRIFGSVAIEDTFGKVMTVIRRRSI